MLRRLPGWVPAVLLLVLTLGIGPALGGAVRPLFVLGCGAAGWWAWRKSPAAHLQAVLALFCFAPFVRRVVDVSAGFDQQSLMLIGPLLAILAPAVELRRLAEPNRPAIPGLAPGLVVIACVFYGALLSMFQADWFNAANGALKWIAPILYALVLQQRGVDGGAMAQAAARAFLLILPIMGLYGLLQYFDPQRWDIYWMQYASITSAGYPVSVRHSPVLHHERAGQLRHVHGCRIAHDRVPAARLAVARRGGAGVVGAAAVVVSHGLDLARGGGAVLLAVCRHPPPGGHNGGGHRGPLPPSPP